ncbi:Ig-like V-type domain-containing protein FAM187A [Uloborus diversus]|uniref:Ig-like V-type domain-containing protein FAM187A n=1 Tax=Uloborus diversus TaxID=327109 RepID=UPI00240A1FF4|nr:Ig-like V-type domain-containing protein FAM187A [Uloborus diversus]
MDWSEWSPCNRCGAVGRRRKVGVCSIRKLDPSKPSKPVDSPLFSEYRKGIPCRSSLLPKKIRDLSIVVNTKSEFVIGFCQIPCPSESGIVVVTDSSGKMLDTVDNSQGIYSMQQPLPPLPDLVKRKTLYGEEGSPILMTCPGNTEGKFFVWRNESFVINPSKVHVRTKGRVKIDLANNLIIRQLRYSDSAIYSCWDDKKLVGTVRLQVTEKALSRRYRIYILNLGVLFVFLVILMISVTLCKNVRLQTKE